MATRTKIAKNISADLLKDRSKAIKRAAAWLVTNKKTHQTKYLTNDIAVQLQKRGYVFARVTTANKLSEQTQEKLKSYIAKTTNAKEVEIEIIFDKTLVGGIRIETPIGAFDDSVQSRLNSFVKEVENE